MSKTTRRKKKSESDESDLILPETFRDATNLSNGELNTLLKRFNLSTKGKRNHKVTALCEHLGLDTTGLTLRDPFLQTLRDVKNLKSGWSTDIRQVPEVKLHKIISYLLAAHDITVRIEGGEFENYTESTLKSYKALRSYDLWESGHVHSIEFNALEGISNFCAVKCLANPSGDSSGTQYNVLVVLKETGEPVGASCTCVAGLGEACTHVAGLLFGLEDFVSRGYRNLTDGQATTEKLCKWIVPKGTAVTPAAIKTLSVGKRAPFKDKKKKVFSASNYNPVVESKRPVDFDKLLELRQSLGLSYPNVPWLKAIAPAVTEKYRPPERPKPKPASAPDALPDKVNYLDHELIPSFEVEVKTSSDPLSIHEKASIFISSSDKENIDPGQLVKSFVNELVYSEEELGRIEYVTRGQGDNTEWRKYKKGIITASNFKTVSSRVNSILKGKDRDENLNTKVVNTLLYTNVFKGNTATQYGLCKEPVAAQLYLTNLKSEHSSLSLKKSGLHVHKQYGYLGASPDRIATCACHGRRLVEIKCPFRLAEGTASVHDLEYVGFENGAPFLKKTSAYYHQVQGQMAITGIEACDLVIYNGRENTLTVIPVIYDEIFWQEELSKLCYFFKRCVVPRLLCVSINLDSVQFEPVTAFCNTATINKQRKVLQKEISHVTNNYPCGSCGLLLKETVTKDIDASVGCDCSLCSCGQWFHWSCVKYDPADDDDDDDTWLCLKCTRDCVLN